MLLIFAVHFYILRIIIFVLLIVLIVEISGHQPMQTEREPVVSVCLLSVPSQKHQGR